MFAQANESGVITREKRLEVQKKYRDCKKQQRSDQLKTVREMFESSRVESLQIMDTEECFM